MSFISSAGHDAVLVREADAEVLGQGASVMRLIADSAETDGVLNANRSTLAPGADGARPHYHTGSAEIFFVLDGSLRALAGDQVTTVGKGDFLLVPRNMPHAFAATPESGADVLIIFAPAIKDRFEYFRLLDRVVKGQASPQEILDTQDRFDNHFLDSAAWREAHG